MPYKQLFSRAEAREKIVRGAAAVADAVRVTLGPKSKCVFIGKKWGRPLVCNAGVTIAKEIEIKDAKEISALKCCGKRPNVPVMSLATAPQLLPSLRMQWSPKELATWQRGRARWI